MNFSELKSETFRQLREESSDSVFWRDTDVEVALNEGYFEMTDASEWFEKYQTVHLLPEQPYYDARTLLRKPFLALGPAYNNTTSRWLRFVTSSDLDAADPRWEQRLAEPECFMIRGLWWLSYWPQKSTAVGSVKQYYKALPDLLSADTDVPGFHSSFHQGLIEYALFDLHAQDAETSLAVSHWEKYLEYETALMAYVDGRNARPLERGHGS